MRCRADGDVDDAPLYVSDATGEKEREKCGECFHMFGLPLSVGSSGLLSRARSAMSPPVMQAAISLLHPHAPSGDSGDCEKTVRLAVRK